MGDIFMVNEDDLDNPDQRLAEIIQSGQRPEGNLDLDRLLHHEERHSQQWARAGHAWFIAQYGFEALGGECLNRFEEDAGFSDGGYDCDPAPVPTPTPGPSPTPPG